MTAEALDDPTPSERPDRGRWDLRVEPMFFVTGLVVAAVAMVATLVLTGAHLVASAVVVAPLLVLAAAWGVARWLGPSARPAERQAGIVVSVLVWLVIGGIVRRLVVWVVPDPFAFGLAERAWLMPAVFGLVYVLGERLRLRAWVTFVAALAFMGTLTAESLPRDTDRRVASSSAIQLAAARASGDTVLMRSTDLAAQPHPRTPTRSAIGVVEASATCGSVAGQDQRRTALGLRGREIVFRSEVCWDAKGAPVSAELDVTGNPRSQTGGFRPVELDAADPFGMANPGPRPTASGAASTTPLPLAEQRTAAGRGVFRPNGDPVGAVPASSNQPSYDAALLRVSSDGHRVQMVYALTSRDPLARRSQPSSLPGDDTSEDAAADETNGTAGHRLFALRTRDGHANDLVTVTAWYHDGGAVEIGAALIRSTSHGSTLLRQF
ncbi:MAG: hypothetical protein AAGC46_10030 [Solirubrobacteraceae bacterium]|nr:hypothetical protein [Patulibacter sp.]